MFDPHGVRAQTLEIPPGSHPGKNSNYQPDCGGEAEGETSERCYQPNIKDPFLARKKRKIKASNDNLRKSLIPVDECQSPAHDPLKQVWQSAAAPAVSSGAGESRLRLQSQPQAESRV